MVDERDEGKQESATLRDADRRTAGRYRVICSLCHWLLLLCVVGYVVLSLVDDRQWDAFQRNERIQGILVLIPLPIFLVMVVTEVLTPRIAKKGFQWGVLLIVGAYAWCFMHSIMYGGIYDTVPREKSMGIFAMSNVFREYAEHHDGRLPNGLHDLVEAGLLIETHKGTWVLTWHRFQDDPEEYFLKDPDRFVFAWGAELNERGLVKGTAIPFVRPASESPDSNTRHFCKRVSQLVGQRVGDKDDNPASARATTQPAG